MIGLVLVAGMVVGVVVVVLVVVVMMVVLELLLETVKKEDEHCNNTNGEQKWRGGNIVKRGWTEREEVARGKGGGEAV